MPTDELSPEARKFRSPNFDPELVKTCAVGFCGIGNSVMPKNRRYCTYMEQTIPFTRTDGPTPAELASNPDWAGWMRPICPFGDAVYELRTRP